MYKRQDDRLLVKPTKSAISYMPTVTYEIPYENAKEMLLVEEIDNKMCIRDRYTSSRYQRGHRPYQISLRLLLSS